MIQQDKIISICPHCKEVLIEYYTTKNLNNYCKVFPNIQNGSSGKFVYHDGDTVQIDEEKVAYKYNRFDAELLEGKCPMCTNYYFSIKVCMSSRPVMNYQDDNQSYYIQANTPEAQEVHTYMTKGDIPIISLLYKDAKVEDDPDNSYLEVEEYTIGPFALPTTISGEYGVSIHDNELNIWDEGAKMLKCFLNKKAEQELKNKIKG
ncbi:hypothetical protein COL32_12130 [Bacillus pseudomycoides]|uniref:Uncharacterized protein n=1 Tax=Bacillus pseudomycoides TaxID=64104 RepID=A0ABD6T9F4_9BACI|nr:hypothetical protein [Bacillus pseudomycoides]PFX44595.1 hypothetical protein COL32_12130 [Bacillus pseudomycoides]PHE99955.1 hypothetical protein COF81_09565 [Bacillus pseudomycoides]